MLFTIITGRFSFRLVAELIFVSLNGDSYEPADTLGNSMRLRP